MKSVDKRPSFAQSTALVLGLALAGSAWGQGSGPARSGEGPGPRAEDLRETLTVLMMVRMKSELNLTKEQYEQILPKIEDLEKARQAGFQSRRDLGIRLKSLFLQISTSEAEFSEIVDKLTALDEAEHRRDQAFFADLKKLLTPRQQGQFLLFRQRFRGWLEERMRQMREMRSMGPGRLRPERGHEGGPGGDELDEGVLPPR